MPPNALPQAGPPMSQPVSDRCPSPARGKGITARAVLLGLALVVANSFWLVDLEMIESRSYPSDLALFLNVIAFLLLLLALNRLLRAVAPGTCLLTQAELVVIYVMLAMGTASPARTPCRGW